MITKDLEYLDYIEELKAAVCIVESIAFSSTHRDLDPTYVEKSLCLISENMYQSIQDFEKLINKNKPKETT